MAGTKRKAPPLLTTRHQKTVAKKKGLVPDELAAIVESITAEQANEKADKAEEKKKVAEAKAKKKAADAQQFQEDRAKLFDSLKEVASKGFEHVCGLTNPKMKQPVDVLLRPEFERISGMNKAELKAELEQRWVEVEPLLGTP
eukprot:CAMPEP_0194067806 /NCGR_PEP_ID=MMETSP0009_2-20130614/86750_1 /TAXON_ID=210454 /ORGANISM="Grammatophora oceanica, Strain CCMP 410" /LENGTH=142 /DNA_ID=CAMNT_0038720847 /DNA_START=1948 /DNA_END=2378 /DNA_ORIENTATION=-